MKKILLTLAAVLTFTSAVANNNTHTVQSKVLADNTADTFVLEKAQVNLNTLNIENVVIASSQSCSQTCFNTLTACTASGLPNCNSLFIRCIDTCEGAGGLYH